VVATDPIEGERRPGSVGRALPHVRITAIDDDWNDLPPGEVGDLCSGPTVDGAYEPMRAYLGQSEATAEALRDGRLRWGDVGYVDEEGFVFLVDRRHDVIIRGGMNVYPRQVEEVAYELEGVVECAVVGMPDARLGEVPVAFVRTTAGGPDAGAVLGFVNARVPRYARLAEVRLVEDFPRNALGKILKRELRTGAAAG
jgi:long-chain acyl-CoA synthetase